jgi:hypothetical protein
MAEAKLAQLFWEALDRVAYALTFARLWLIDVIHGPEAQTPADEKREADRERLQEAFPDVDFDETIAITGEERHAHTEATLTAPLRASGGHVAARAFGKERRHSPVGPSNRGLW